jgi:hypothetical protein
LSPETSIEIIQSEGQNVEKPTKGGKKDEVIWMIDIWIPSIVGVPYRHLWARKWIYEKL